MKKITKKHISEVLRSGNAKAIYQLYFLISGERPTHRKVRFFIEDNAPTKKIAKNAFSFCDFQEYKNRMKRAKCENEEVFKKAYIFDYLKTQCSQELNNYTKVPTYGHTNLYFCSPAYGHNDYNKWKALPIKGNERFCDLLISYSQKHLTY